MPIVSRDELKQRLERDKPHVLAPVLPDTRDRSDDLPPLADMVNTSDVVVHAAAITEVAMYLRNVVGYGLLSDIVVTDLLDYNVFELVYRFYTIAGGGDLVVKVRVPRDTPEVPSLTPIWPGADLNEREAFDLFGIIFTSHPYLKRIYMWDEFEGFPMRKDFPKQGDSYLEGS